MNPSRRSIITGLVSLVAAPAIVRASSLMPVKTFAADAWVGRVVADLSYEPFAETYVTEAEARLFYLNEFSDVFISSDMKAALKAELPDFIVPTRKLMAIGDHPKEE